MNENKDFERLMKDYYAQMQQLIEKNRRLRQQNPQSDAAPEPQTAPNDRAEAESPHDADNMLTDSQENMQNNDENAQNMQNNGENEQNRQENAQNSDNVPKSPVIPATPENPEMPPADSFGSLAVQVTTARGAVPVEGALVVISEDGEDGAERMLFTLQTNNSGETQTVRLATYPLSLSQNPDFFGKPYKDYTITTSKPGYYTVINKNVPVFADRFSIQPVNMIALPENFNGDKTIIITERETLQEGMGGQPQTLESDNKEE